ncbi:MAG: transposase [Saprospiraceae bacterium]
MAKKPKVIYHWYKNIISDYQDDQKNGKFLGQKVYEYDKDSAEVTKELKVHIIKPDNMGSSMIIDEKMIGHKYSVIISNEQTGKIALLLDTMKPELIGQAIQLFDVKSLNKVENVCSDMSPMMKKIIKQYMPNATNTIDKYHVIKQVIDALNGERLKIKRDIRISSEVNKDNPNGWTDIEFLEKCRYWIYIRKSNQSQEQKEYLEKLYQKFPTLKQAVELTEEIRSWYDNKNIGQQQLQLEKLLDRWLVKIEQSKLSTFKFVIKLFEKHHDQIIGYFKHGHTSAKGENLNGRIQRFLLNSYGTRDRDFFFYRVQVYFS